MKKNVVRRLAPAFVAGALALSFSVACGGSMGGGKGLPSFGADMGKQEMMGREVRVPYTSLASYYGYIQPGAEPDEVREGKKMYYLYLWVPAVAPEIGVRMLSPVAGLAKPGKGDFVHPEYDKNAAGTAYFDTWVRVERCLAAVAPEDITKPCGQWQNYGDNDDSSELPANPGGQKYNSVLRITSDPNDPMKALVRGMYRIAFTTYKTGEVEGTFLAQVGAPVELPGTAIAKTPEELQKLASAPAAASN